MASGVHAFHLGSGQGFPRQLEAARRAPRRPPQWGVALGSTCVHAALLRSRFGSRVGHEVRVGMADVCTRIPVLKRGPRRISPVPANASQLLPLAPPGFEGV